MKVNHEAVEKAKRLIDEGKFRISTPWRDAQPSITEEDRFIDNHGLAAFGQWYLALDPNVKVDTKERYKFPFGDFNAVHRTGVIAATCSRSTSSGDTSRKSPAESRCAMSPST